MKNLVIAILMATTLALSATTDSIFKKYGLTMGTPQIESFNEMTFGPDGILFIGDSKGAKIFAIDTQDTIASEIKTGFLIRDFESKVADKLGLSKEDIMFHEMALNPISKNIYISISLKRREWTVPWKTPDKIAYSDILLKIDINTKEITKVNLTNIFFSQYNVTDAPPHGLEVYNYNQRRHAFTDMKFRDNKLLLSGKSADGLSSVFRVLDFPFSQTVKSTKIEYYYYTHDQYYSFHPVTAFETYIENGHTKLLAVFYGAPLVTYNLEDFNKSDTTKIRGENVGEFWGGHSKPLDMIKYKYKNIDYVLISLSNRGIAKFKLDDIKAFKGDLVARSQQLSTDEHRQEQFTGSEVGVTYRVFPGPVQQMANYSEDHFMALQRVDNGNLILGLREKRHLAMFAEHQGIKEYIEQYINRNSIASGINELKSVLKRRRTEYVITERDLNGLGYSFIASSNLDTALEVFKAYVQTYPESANAHDSLGEAYMKKGDTKNAIINYEKSLELNPTNNNAKEMLKTLKQ